MRRRACGYFASYPDAKRSELLVAALGGQQHFGVARRACKRWRKGRRWRIPPPWKNCWPNPIIRCGSTAAMALARWKLDSGRAALERLAADGDPNNPPVDRPSHRHDRCQRITAHADQTLGRSARYPPRRTGEFAQHHRLGQSTARFRRSAGIVASVGRSHRRIAGAIGRASAAVERMVSDAISAVRPTCTEISCGLPLVHDRHSGSAVFEHGGSD